MGKTEATNKMPANVQPRNTDFFLNLEIKECMRCLRSINNVQCDGLDGHL